MSLRRRRTSFSAASRSGPSASCWPSVHFGCPRRSPPRSVALDALIYILSPSPLSSRAMDNILEQVRDAVDAPIDFQGQQVATVVNYAMMSVFGVRVKRSTAVCNPRIVNMCYSLSPSLSASSPLLSITPSTLVLQASLLPCLPLCRLGHSTTAIQ